MTIEIDKEEELECLAAFNASNDYVRVVLKKEFSLDKDLYPNIKFTENIKNTDNKDYSVSETEANDVKFQKWARDVKSLDSEVINMGVAILRGVREQGL